MQDTPAVLRSTVATRAAATFHSLLQLLKIWMPVKLIEIWNWLRQFFHSMTLKLSVISDDFLKEGDTDFFLLKSWRIRGTGLLWPQYSLHLHVWLRKIPNPLPWPKTVLSCVRKKKFCRCWRKNTSFHLYLQTFNPPFPFSCLSLFFRETCKHAQVFFCAMFFSLKHVFGKVG